MGNDINIISYLEAGIKGESARQSAIANNIANMNTPGYRRFDVKFEQALAKAIDSKGESDFSKLQPEFCQPKDMPLNDRGNDVSLDVEIGKMVKNSLRHKALVRLLKRKYEQYSMAIRTQ